MESDTEHIVVEKRKLMDYPWDSSEVLGIVAAVVAVLLTLVIFILYRRRKNIRQGVLLLGLCDSGKTLIFSRLIHGKFVKTFTSVKENIGNYLAGSVLLKVIDVPGHERLRNRFFDEYKSTARALVFVIDSLTIQKDIRDVAEFLYNCLADNVILSMHPPVLILCNKQDETMAKGSTLIKTILEKEINILRKTKTSQLDAVEKTSEKIFLGKEGKDFEFSHLQPLRVELAEGTAFSQEDESKYDLESLQEWIDKIV